MKPHDTYLALAATAVDYPLALPDRTRLEAHLARARPAPAGPPRTGVTPWPWGTCPR